MSTTTNGTGGGVDLSKLVYVGYGTADEPDHTIDLNEINESTKHRLMTRGLTHVLGNEVASKMLTEFAKVVKDRKEAGEPDFDADETEAEKARITRELRDDTVTRIESGEWVTSTRAAAGPRLSSFESELKTRVANVVRARFRQWVKEGKAKADTAAKNWTLTQTGKVLSLDDGIKIFMDSTHPETMSHKEKLVAEAHKAVADKAEAAKLAASAPAGDLF